MKKKLAPKPVLVFSFLVFIICVPFLIRYVLNSYSQLQKYLLLRKAGSCFDARQWDEAIKTYEKLLTLDPQEPMMYWELGLAYREKGDRAGAQRQAKELRRLGYLDWSERLETLLAESDRIIFYSGENLPSKGQ
ncbi:MAG: tetratricopeptide repeat protein [Candidatus Omnitrophota bacterium]